MIKTLIGSSAIKHWYPDFNRVPKDTDFAVDKENIKSGSKGIEYLFNPIIADKNEPVLFPSKLLTLKVSHLFWNINWNKHMWDVQFLLGKGLKIDLELMRQLRTFWEDYLPKVRRSDLNNSKEDFFSNSVNKDTEEHDNLHLKIAEVPAYTKILKGEVEICPLKFEVLPFEEKVDVVVEEAVVMAYERYHNKLPFYQAFHIQLIQNIQKHYPECIALFAIENYPLVSDIKRNNIKEKYEKLC